MFSPLLLDTSYECTLWPEIISSFQITFFFSFQDSPVTLAKLEELRKLGFTNDAMNIQALQIANGDLETAVNLILCGLNEDN